MLTQLSRTQKGWNMKRYRYLIYFVIISVGLCAGCRQESFQRDNPVITSALSPTTCIADEPTTDIFPTPTMTLSERYDAEEVEREKIKEALMITPTPGPEPYDLFETAREVEVGDVVVFGNYVHSFASAYSDDISIRWLVLDKKDDKVLVISLYNITIGSFVNLETYLEYEENDTALVWETSDVRKFLNDFFLILAFSPEEALCITNTNVQTQDNALYGTDGGSNTTDKIFLLSIEEVEKYFITDTERKTQIIPDVEIGGEMIYAPQEHRPNTTDYYDWWLRSPGKTEEYAACVGQFGDIMKDGQLVYDSQVAYRPAMWIDLSKVKEIGLEMAVEE